MNENGNKHWWLYVFRCVDDKWYVGITTKTPEERFIEHRDNIRSAGWTRQHKPVELFNSRDLGRVTEDRAKLAENRAVRKYMLKYGIDNVRGGNLSQIQPYKQFANRIYPWSEWEWARVSFYLLALSGILLIMYMVEHFTK